MAGERGGLGADALHQVAVGADPVGVVVLHLAAVLLAQEALGEREADGVRDALAERAGRDLDAGGVMDLGVARRARAPGAEVSDLLQRHVRVAGQVETGVQQHRAVTGRQHEAVAVGPVRVLRVVAHHLREEEVADRRHAHRHAGVAVAGVLDRVHRERADGVDGELLGGGLRRGGGHWHPVGVGADECDGVRGQRTHQPERVTSARPPNRPGRRPDRRSGAAGGLRS